ncbi:MAG: hypothetical protein QNJ58_06665 [Desulfobacterales bacterium]|nr:hypothetical protein [Desulfobacterales bacterium]
MYYRLSVAARVLVWGMFFVTLAGTAPFCVSSSWPADKYTKLSTESQQLEQAIHLAAGYLTRHCQGTGQFVYRINVNPEFRPKPRYNFLRHAGTIYALASYQQAYPQEAAKNAIKRAAQFLKVSAVFPLAGRDDLIAVWSPPEITGSGKPLQAKLGGTGLGLIALLSVEKIMPGSTPLEYLRRMGEFLLYMQKADGSFYSKYIPAKGGRDDSWTSLYYPGEAALGLLMLYENDASLPWLQSAANAVAFLARKREGKKAVEADHWALLATAKLLPLYGRCRKPVPEGAIIRHAVQICESILNSRPLNYKDTLEYGCFTNDGRTTPTAIRLEGMLAVLSFLPDAYESLRQRMRSAIDDGIRFLLRSQIRSGEFAGGIPRALRGLPETHPGFTRSFNRRATEVRIDYVQHALSAMLQYQQAFF